MRSSVHRSCSLEEAYDSLLPLSYSTLPTNEQMQANLWLEKAEFHNHITAICYYSILLRHYGGCCHAAGA